ncbi:hypothetical protein [Streptomyces mashuensis]
MSEAMPEDAPPEVPEPATDTSQPAGPRPLGVERAPTGHDAVDAALARLADADDLDVGGHPEVYEDVHQGLRDALGALDQRPGPQGPPRPYDHRS